MVQGSYTFCDPLGQVALSSTDATFQQLVNKVLPGCGTASNWMVFDSCPAADVIQVGVRQQMSVFGDVLKYVICWSLCDWREAMTFSVPNLCILNIMLNSLKVICF